jgi:hypothetical protein
MYADARDLIRLCSTSPRLTHHDLGALSMPHHVHRAGCAASRVLPLVLQCGTISTSKFSSFIRCIIPSPSFFFWTALRPPALCIRRRHFSRRARTSSLTHGQVGRRLGRSRTSSRAHRLLLAPSGRLGSRGAHFGAPLLPHAHSPALSSPIPASFTPRASCHACTILEDVIPRMCSKRAAAATCAKGGRLVGGVHESAERQQATSQRPGYLRIDGRDYGRDETMKSMTESSST